MATGILLPIFFHAAGLGSVFLPMFWPVAVSAFLLPFPFAPAVGVLTPLLSFIMTGMPPPPILYKMLLELSALAASVRMLYSKTRLGTLWIMLIAIILSEGIGLLGSALIAPVLGWPRELYAAASLLQILPGLFSMLIMIPPVINRLLKEPIFGFRKNHVKSP